MVPLQHTQEKKEGKRERGKEGKRGKRSMDFVRTLKDKCPTHISNSRTDTDTPL
jgi:hypothetical protein